MELKFVEIKWQDINEESAKDFCIRNCERATVIKERRFVWTGKEWRNHDFHYSINCWLDENEIRLLRAEGYNVDVIE